MKRVVVTGMGGVSATVAANLAQFFEMRGRVVASCSACTSGQSGDRIRL
jgi:saccharopine dehydrogenase-like NADP-dependent oxidoreductase